MIKYETLSRKKMMQQYKKHNLIEKQEKRRHSRTIQMSPFSNQNYFTNKTLYRPTSASLNIKANLSNTLKKSKCFKKLLNQSKNHRIDNQEIIRISEKFVESFKNKNKNINENNFFNDFWEEQVENRSNKKISNFQNHQKIQIKIKGAIYPSSQQAKVNSFQEFVQSRKRIQTRKKNNHPRTKSQAENKSVLNRHFQVNGRRKEVEVKQKYFDGKRCQNSSLEYKQLYKKYLQKLVEEQTQQFKQIRPSSALDSNHYQLQGFTLDTKKKSQPTGIHTEQKDEKSSKIDKYQQYLFNRNDKKVPTRKLLIERSKKFSNQLIQKHQSFKVKKNTIDNQLQGWKHYNQEQFDFLI